MVPLFITTVQDHFYRIDMNHFRAIYDVKLSTHMKMQPWLSIYNHITETYFQKAMKH